MILSKLKICIVVFLASFSIAFVFTTVYQLEIYKKKFAQAMVFVERAETAQKQLIADQKESILNQKQLVKKLADIGAKNSILNKHYDDLKDSYRCDRPAKVDKILNQSICNYAISTGGECK